MRIPRKLVATFSICGYDPASGEIGVAVQSKFLAVGAVVPWVKAGVGAIATQSWANTSYGPDGLKLLEEGLSPREVIERLTGSDEGRNLRQVGIIDAKGRSASYTGTECYPWAGGLAGENFACQGNILVGAETVRAMAETFNSVRGDLAEKLLAALDAGQQAGGDSRGKQSAALYVAKEKGGYGGYNDRYIDLRVDDHPDPIKELIRIHGLYKLYFYKTVPDNIITIEGPLITEIQELLNKWGYPTPVNGVVDVQFNEALKTFYLTENFDERICDDGYIDKEVLAFMRRKS
ncbi:DUF1028 domain-containing protein [Desulfotruncus alcoholivorax]|uniref:DUF1028 domain-containing protein n=1 Tax=Desulfotruncus alcoholivorax TaxID=265477 RepID=UPI0003F982D2|nr:DUF1028 domain-containing protein [Desulfotruncus alcoholivorax]